MEAPVTGGKAAIAALEAAGVEVVFGIPGVHTLALYDALGSLKIRHILARHEQGAGFMADGYARASGRPGVALDHHRARRHQHRDPNRRGLHRLLARPRSSPRTIAANTSTRCAAVSTTSSDQRAVMAAVTKWNSQRDATPRTCPLPSRGVAPTPLRPPPPRPRRDSRSMSSTSPRPMRAFPIQPARGAVQPDPGSERRRRRLHQARGEGRHLLWRRRCPCRCPHEIVALAERLGAPVVSSIMGKGSVPEDHPLSLGALLVGPATRSHRHPQRGRFASSGLRLETRRPGHL